MPEKWNTQIYYYISLNPFPTYKKVLKEILKGDDTFYNKDMHMDIKFYYETLFNLNMQAFYTKYRNKIINAYDKTIDKKNDTKTKFCNNLEKQLGKVVNVIKQILDYIANNGEHSKVEYTMYSTKIVSWIKKLMTNIHYEDGYSFERFMDARYPYLSSVEYKKRTPTRNDTDYLNNIDDFLS